MKEHIWKIYLIVVLVSVFVLIGIVGYARPLVIAPLDEYESDGDVLFVIEKANVLFIDDNMDFSSPDEYWVAEGLRIELEPGEYYWKAVGVLGSEVRTLTILSRVELRLVKTADGMGVVNVGNVGLNVDVYDGVGMVDRVKLSRSEVLEVGGKGDKFIGEYDE